MNDADCTCPQEIECPVHDALRVVHGTRVDEFYDPIADGWYPADDPHWTE